MGISHLRNKRIKNTKQSAAISDHLPPYECNFNFFIKENLLIAQDNHDWNNTVKSFSLELFQ